MSDRTAAQYSVSEDTRVKMPIRILLVLLATAGAGAVAWDMVRRDVAEHTRRIDALELDTRSSREVLIRIDERTAEIKRRMDLER